MNSGVRIVMLLLGVLSTSCFFTFVFAGGTEPPSGHIMLAASIDDAVKQLNVRNVSSVFLTARNIYGQKFSSWVKNISSWDRSSLPLFLISSDHPIILQNLDIKNSEESTFYSPGHFDTQHSRLETKEIDTCPWWEEFTSCTCKLHRSSYQIPKRNVGDLDCILVEFLCLKHVDENKNVDETVAFDSSTQTATTSKKPTFRPSAIPSQCLKEWNRTHHLYRNRTKFSTRQPEDQAMISREVVYLTVLCLFWTLVIGF